MSRKAERQVKVLSGGTWGRRNITVLVSLRLATTQTTQTTQKSTTPATTMTTTQEMGAAGKLLLTVEITPSYNLERNESMDYGWYSPATKHTFTVTGNYAVLGFEYSVSQVAAATVSLEDSLSFIPETELEMSVRGWNSAPNLTINVTTPKQLRVQQDQQLLNNHNNHSNNNCGHYKPYNYHYDDNNKT